MNKSLKRIVLSFAVGICFMLVVLLAVLVDIKSPLKIDMEIAKFFKVSSGWFIDFLKVFTHIGSIYCLAVIMMILCFLKKKTYGVVGTVFLAVSGLIGVAIKYIIRRERPIATHIEEIGYSFPSAHAMLTLFTLGFVCYVIYELIKNKALKYSLISLLSVIILVVSFSRIILGVHYFTDILAGWLVAIPFLNGAILTAEHFLKHPVKLNKRLM